MIPAMLEVWYKLDTRVSDGLLLTGQPCRYVVSVGRRSLMKNLVGAKRIAGFGNRNACCVRAPERRTTTIAIGNATSKRLW